ncbi:hypothetical protein MTES_3360 [Microbacterium testaceum StLB037]|uniref:Uncharacterized protein n=1 Tax=Microbacterium testaceum (strain StLB037) TaxID=979556 RepID=E8NE70_MICTS|nr:hypothetical protein [Microbacterium testaceum]BAJ76324.1 hypothetical protein MTES_3360 [Microbacterium testaceum StLB037]
MSTSENNGTPPLTRRQLREIRNTGATPIIPTQPVEPVADAAPEAPAVELTPAVPQQPTGREEPSTPADDTAATADTATSDGPAEEPAPAQPTTTPEPAVIGFGTPAEDASSTYAPTGLTRRQVRAQEKIRTASVPVISPDLAPASPQPRAESTDDKASADLPAIFRPAVAEELEGAEPAPEPVSSTVNPDLGSDLLNGATPDISLPPSFDQLIARSGVATGSVSTPNALILSETPIGGPLVAPVTATGEVMITGTFELPQGLGSVGHAPGTTDGREADAVLLDGELPAASSPTPIAASAAISTVKQPGDIIRPPAPEKGSKLVIGLIITTGALAIAVAVALAIAVTTGVFG